MTHRSTFIHPADTLPRWMGVSRYDKFRPMDMPVSRPQQLTIEQAMGQGFELCAATNRESSPEPAANGLSGDADHSGDGGLAASGEKSVLDGGAILKHVDIVTSASAECQSNAANPMFKLGMGIWKHIEDELHRRRLNAAWLGRKLHFFGNICIHALSVAHV